MSMFRFGVSLVPLHFLCCFPFRYPLLRFPKHTISFLQRSYVFKVSLCCDFLRCMCSLISLKEVYRSRNVVVTIHYSNLKMVCLTH
jgi:hypothetical protein